METGEWYTAAAAVFSFLAKLPFSALFLGSFHGTIFKKGGEKGGFPLFVACSVKGDGVNPVWTKSAK